MTVEETKRKTQLENKIAYGGGIYQSEWSELIELRKKLITLNGENPNDFNLDSRNCTRKAIYE